MSVIGEYSSVEEYENSGQASFDYNITRLHTSYVEQEQKIDPAFHELAMAASTRLNKYWSIIYRASADGNADTGGTTGGIDAGASSGDNSILSVHPWMATPEASVEQATIPDNGVVIINANLTKNADGSISAITTYNDKNDVTNLNFNTVSVPEKSLWSRLGINIVDDREQRKAELRAMTQKWANGTIFLGSFGGTGSSGLIKGTKAIPKLVKDVGEAVKTIRVSEGTTEVANFLAKGLSKAEGVLQNINTRNVVTKTAEETNQWWKAKGLDKPPVREGTKVMEAELRKETSGFVRVYDDVNSFQKGGWLMRKEDIIGLTPEQIKDKFALKYVPKYVADVKLPADTKIRISEANEIPGWGKGGGTQIDLLDERVGEFFNPRSLEGEWW